MKQHINNLTKKKGVRELIKYGLVGLVGLIIDLGVYFLLFEKLQIYYPFTDQIYALLGEKISVDVINSDISHIISSVLAITNNFILNSYFTFKVTDNKLRRFFSFSGIAVIGLVVSTALMTVFVGTFNMDGMMSKIFATCIVAAMQFCINKFFTFKQTKKDD